MGSLIAFALHALAAAALVLAACLASYAISTAVIPRRPTLLRWIGTVVIGLWTANAAFHLLAAFRAFTLPAAFSGAVLLMLVLSRLGLVAESRTSFARDRRVVRWLMQRRISAPRLWMIGCFSLFGALLMIRTLVVPPLSWDTLTYHAVKAALWVQNAGELPLRTPGGWSAYRNYFGGGEILWAWAMLPFGADTLAPVVDAVEWLALGLAMVAVARELGVREPIASAQAGFVLMVPTFQLVLGSGYVELALNLAFVSGMAFAIRFMRRPAPSAVEGPRPVWLALALTGLGVAGGVKVTALPLLAVMVAALTLRAALTRGGIRRYAGAFLVGSAAIALMTLPWMANNVRESGYPLSPMPISVAGVTLGEPNEAISWYDERPDLKSTRQSEIFVLAQIFRLPPARNENLGALVAIPLALLPLGIAIMAKSSKSTALTLSCLVLVILAGFYSPAFRTVRLGWSVSASRFLMPLVCLAAPLGAVWCRYAPRAARLYFGVLSSAIIFHALLLAMIVWAPLDARAAITAFAMATLIAAIALTARFRRLPALARLALAIVLAIGSLQAANVWRERHRYEMARESTVLHFIPRYWVRAAAFVDTAPTPKKIAVTAGPQQSADNWFLYYFLGRKLQNELTHVPATLDGRIHQLGRIDEHAAEADANVWLQRLGQERVTHVMSFAPRSVELAWMEERPEHFQRVIGAPGRWGLFSVAPGGK